MLEIRPTCEHCNKSLPFYSKEAMICTFECTYCTACAKEVFKNICPNCGGNFTSRQFVQNIYYPNIQFQLQSFINLKT
ncbi:DUF1272 domain-containing protein [Lacinutrix sp. WUR7]|uniref:DUF1272 domain-containing protein n=1 Tax=Lacinutrix sp. WUR7 TaxID=2653681 RepID=UPI00351C7307